MSHRPLLICQQILEHKKGTGQCHSMLRRKCPDTDVAMNLRVYGVCLVSALLARVFGLIASAF